MTEPAPTPSAAPRTGRLPDTAYERMALILRLGLALSLALLVGAIAAYLIRHPTVAWTASEANPSGTFLTVGGLAAGLSAGSPIAYLTLGILVLIATPVVRVLSGLYYFRKAGERAIAGIAAAVLAMLLFGLLVLGPLVR